MIRRKNGWSIDAQHPAAALEATAAASIRLLSDPGDLWQIYMYIIYTLHTMEVFMYVYVKRRVEFRIVCKR